MRAILTSASLLALAACAAEPDNSGFIDADEYEVNKSAAQDHDDHDHDSDGVQDQDHDHNHDGDDLDHD